MTRVIRTTIKKFVFSNMSNLYIKRLSDFDSNDDGVRSVESEFTPVQFSTRRDNEEHTFGIHGAWFVGRSRDYFDRYEDDKYVGYLVSNCCGSFILAVSKDL